MEYVVYKILSEHSIALLEREVRLWMYEGYRPRGGVGFVSGLYLQAMSLEGREWPEKPVGVENGADHC